MFISGVMPEIPSSKGYISDEYMAAVYDDEELRAFSMSELQDGYSESVDSKDIVQGEQPGSTSVRVATIGVFSMIGSLLIMTMHV